MTLGEALAKAQVQKNPVTGPKRSPKAKRPLSHRPPAHRYSFDGNAPNPCRSVGSDFCFSLFASTCRAVSPATRHPALLPQEAHNSSFIIHPSPLTSLSIAQTSFQGAWGFFATSAGFPGAIASVITDTSRASLTSSSLEMIFSSSRKVAR